MTKRLLRTTLGVGTFSGLGKGRIRLCWDNRRAPNKEEDLLIFIPLQYDPKTAMWLGLLTGRTSEYSPSTTLGE
jgi:hypothetical protein